MSAVSDPLRALRISAIARVLAGMVLFVSGALTIENAPKLMPFAIALMLVPGILLTSGGTGMFLKLGRIEESQRSARRFQRDTTRTMEGLQTYIFNLLYSVAEADGPATPPEKDMVRRFVLERFQDDQTIARLQAWNDPKLKGGRIEATARSLRDVLTTPDREILFVWVCMVALADQKFSIEERTLLQAISRGLQLSAAHARHLFHQAKQQIMQQRRTQAHETGNDRTRALSVLGLAPNATADDIRKRHRELAKQFHPDAHQSEGPKAVAKATARFRDIQRAYESLRTT